MRLLVTIAILLPIFYTIAFAYPTDNSKRWNEPDALPPNSPVPFMATDRGKLTGGLITSVDSGLRVRGETSETVTAVTAVTGSTGSNGGGSSVVGVVIGAVIGTILGVTNIGAAFIIIRKYYQRKMARERAELLRAATSSPKMLNHPTAYYYEYVRPTSTKMSGGLKSGGTSVKSKAPTISPLPVAKTRERENPVHSSATSTTLIDSNLSRPNSLALPLPAVTAGHPPTLRKGPDQSFMFWD